MIIPFKSKLILASASPRRAELLQKIGVSFEVIPSKVREVIVQPTDPLEYVLKIAEEKAKYVAKMVKEGVVLGADTIVILDKTVLGKPKGDEGAFQILKSLEGRWHEVVTALFLIRVPEGRKVSGWEVTRVKFRPLFPEEIEAYIKTGEPFDKAGGYGIQGYGALLVERIEGCFYNVMGLPLVKLIKLLKGLEVE